MSMLFLINNWFLVKDPRVIAFHIGNRVCHLLNVLSKSDLLQLLSELILLLDLLHHHNDLVWYCTPVHRKYLILFVFLLEFILHELLRVLGLLDMNGVLKRVKEFKQSSLNVNHIRIFDKVISITTLPRSSLYFTLEYFSKDVRRDLPREFKEFLKIIDGLLVK